MHLLGCYEILMRSRFESIWISAQKHEFVIITVGVFIIIIILLLWVKDD